ncbi:Mss4-like protein, partial [Baffinella frigidus]
LNPAQAYSVLHDADTERPFTSPLNKEKRPGVFKCAACATPAFLSETKFNSGTGWPSFYDKLEGVELEAGSTPINTCMIWQVHCVKCGGHFGHVFNDGYSPRPKYCINGLSLAFSPNDATEAA